MAQEFDDLPPDESKRRLRVLAIRMDLNKVQGFISELFHLKSGRLHH